MNIISAVSASRSKRYFSVNGSLLLPLALKWRLVGFIVSVAVTAFVVPCATANPTSAASLTVQLPENLSLSLTPDGNVHEATSNNIIVETDSPAGYQLTISSSDNENTLKDGDNSLSSLEEASGITREDFDTDAYNNIWAYKPSKWNGSENNKYFPGPKEGDVIDDIKIVEGGVANNYTITLGAKVDTSMTPGNYSKSFIITATANTISYSITYYPNNGVDDPWTETSVGEEKTIRINEDLPTKDDYSFLGWCSTETSDETCEGDVYHPGETYRFLDNVYSVKLYAMWAKRITMQDWDGCEDLVLHQVISLYDARDDKVYRVRKLKDGKCWMIDNLRLGGSTAMTLKPEDTNIASEYTLPKSSSSFGSSTAESIYVDEEWGGYYSWKTANAGSTINTQGASSEHSICPKGWRLPTSDADGEFGKLIQAYDSDASALLDKNGPNLSLAGYYATNSNRPTDQGSKGYYWTATSYGRFNSYSIQAANDSVAIENTDSRGNGNAVRCVTGNAGMYSYEITYELDGGENGPDPNPQSGINQLNSVILSDVIPTKKINSYENYIFAGWCDRVVNNNGICDGETYQPGKSYPLSNGENIVKLYAIWRGRYGYDITYHLNGGTGGPANTKLVGYTTDDHMIVDNAPSLDGYYFRGWCYNQEPTNNTTCDGTILLPGYERRLASGANSFDLYAIWGKIIVGIDHNDMGDMQSFQCSRLPNIGDYGTVIDARDGNTYRVRKLVDGKCWMIDNLRLGDTKLINRVLTSENTDLNGISTYTLPANDKEGFKYRWVEDSDARYYDYSAQSVYVVEKTSGKEKLEYGGYYTWNAATANTGAGVAYKAQAPSSICPRGWRLPTGGSEGEFVELNNNLNGGGTSSFLDWVEENGPNFLRGGYLQGGNVVNDDSTHSWDQGSEGYYWSSTSDVSGHSIYGYRFQISDSLVSYTDDPSVSDDSNVYPKSIGIGSYGHSVRCLTE